jgi:hypothetical protein
LRDTYPLGGAIEVWQVRRRLFTQAFRDFYERFAAEGEAKPRYDLPKA